MYQNKVFFMLLVVCWSSAVSVFGAAPRNKILQSYMTGGHKGVHTGNSRYDLDCNQFSSDYDILYHFPFPIVINPMNDAWNKSYAHMIDNGTVVSVLSVANENVVPWSTFCLQNLQGLNIIGTPFPDNIVPDNLENLKQLRQLGIFNTPIVNITEKLGTMSSLTALYLHNCSLTHLPNLNGIPELQFVDLEHNRLSKINGLTGVVNLALSNNLFTDIPTLNRPNTLRYLDMNNNPMENILEIISHINLYRVILRNTTLSSIPATIDRLQQVRYLDLSYNKLLDLPTNMLNLAHLNYLDIRSNLFSSGDVQQFQTRFIEVLPNLSIIA